MQWKFVFAQGAFVSDLKDFLKDSSVRKMSDETGGLMSPSKINRLKNAKSVPSAIDLVIICSIVDKNPKDYYHRVLL